MPGLPFHHLNEIDLIDRYVIAHQETVEYNFFFSSAYGTISRIDHILGHKSSLAKFKKIEIVLSIFFSDNAIRLDITYRGKKTLTQEG